MAQETSLQEREAQELERPERTHDRPTFVPLCDIYETEGGLTILADMPGVDEKNVEVSLERGVLTLKGRAIEEKMDEYQLNYSEYQVGHYERSFQLSEDFDSDKIEASLKHGVLHIFLPKKAETRPRKIAVKTA